MGQSKKGKQWYFGMKAHIGDDAQSGLVYTVECNTAKIADSVKLNNLLHGEEEIVLADRGYHQKNRTLDHFEPENGITIATPHKRRKGKDLSDEQRAEKKLLSYIRALVELPFR